jgi:uncharacterized protein YukE
MSGQFGVSVGDLRYVSNDLHQVSSAMKKVMSTLAAQLAAAGPAWGGGDLGHQFADGPNGYLAQLDWVGGSVEAKTALLDYYSDLLKQVANSFEQADSNGVSSPSAGDGTQTLGGAYGPSSSGDVTSWGPAGANPGIGSADVPAGGPNLATTGVSNGVGSRPEEVVASPITPTDPSAAGGRGSGASPGDGVPEMPPPAGGTPSTPSQGDAAGEDPGPGAATPGAAGAPASGDLPGDGVTAGVGAEDDASGRLRAGTPEGAVDSSTTRDAEPLTGGSTPTLPTLPRLPNPQKRQRANEPEPPSPAEDGPAGPPPAAAKADPGPQRTGPVRVAGGRAGGTSVDRPAQDAAGPPGRLPSVTRRAGVAGGQSIGGQGVARARRSGSDPARGSGITGDSLAADAVGLAVGHRDGEINDGEGAHPGEGRVPVDDALTRSRTDDDDLKRAER